MTSWSWGGGGGKLLLSHLANRLTTNGRVMRVTVTTVASAVRNATCGNIEDNRGPLPSLSLGFICFCFYFPVSPVPKHPCVLLTHPSRASTQPLVTGDICIFNGNYADCWGWAGLPPYLLHTEHPEHAATVTRASSHPFSSHLYSSYLKTQI